MKISFKGHSEAQREVELTQKDLDEMFALLKHEFMNHVEFTSAFNVRTSYLDSGDKVILKLCNQFGVDAEYKKDRVAFFKAVLSAMESPYK